jgi:transcriptional regulator with XRE-family HTH domain
MAISEENVRLIFGLKVRQLRQQKKLSFAQLSKATGLSASYLNEIEKGKKYPKAPKIAQLADALDVSYDWLISLQLTHNLAPVSELLKSNLLTELPLELFGLEPANLLELLSNAPAKLGAFLSTIIEISRNYGMRVENLYLNMLRSYQEMHDNYFESLEEAVQRFLKEYSIDSNEPVSADLLKQVLEEKYHYQVKEDGLKNQTELKELRSVLIPGKSPKLLLNSELSASQKAFALGKEVAYSFLKMTPRPYTTTWLEVNSFEEVLNNFKASYFSCALALPQAAISQDLKQFFLQLEVAPELLKNLLKKYSCSPEMLLHRMTNLLPKVLGIRELFFLRFSTKDEKHFALTKEMHLAGLHNPHGTALDQHYCRRWISLGILKDLRKYQEQSAPEILCQVQRSKYVDSDNEYLIIALAKTSLKSSPNNSSVSIGIRLTPATKKKVKFWNDPEIPIRLVSETCEMCSVRNCKERAADPIVFNEQQHIKEMKMALNVLMES